LVTRRRLLLAAGAGALAAPFAAFSQARIYRIGFIGFHSSSFAPRFDALRAGLRYLGYVEGKNLVIEQRWAEGKNERLPELAAELVRQKPDVIVTHGTPGTLAAKRATATIPIVMAQSGDPVAAGIVPSLSRPGGNVTGLTQLSSQIYGKRLELLKETVPAGVRFGLLFNPTNPAYQTINPEVGKAAAVMKVALHYFEARREEELGAAFAAMSKTRLDGLVITDDSLLTSIPKPIAELATRGRLPSIGAVEYVRGGGMMAHSANFNDMFRRAATYVDRILKGAKPGDLPIEQPVQFETLINVRAAKAIGLSIPRTILVRADRIIE
jgi:putative ABC transport system substrate-binding protein